MPEQISPSPRLKNYREFADSLPTPEESLRIFGRNPALLRRVADLAQASLTSPQHLIQATTEDHPIAEIGMK